MATNPGSAYREYVTMPDKKGIEIPNNGMKRNRKNLSFIITVIRLMNKKISEILFIWMRKLWSQSTLSKC
jgi:hypothetical protein